MFSKSHIDRKDELLNLLHIFQTGDDFIITTHKNCDPDGIGAELGLDYLLAKLGKKKIILNPDKTPERYTFLDPQNRIHYIDETKLTNKTSSQKVVVVDNSDLIRIGEVIQYVNMDKSNLIIIDHHDGIEPFAGLFCFPEFGSTSEIVYEVLELSNIELDFLTASALYAGIVVDTGQFKYGKTRPRTHEIVATLLKKHSFNQEDLIRKLYEDQSHMVLYLKRDIFSTLEVFPEFQLASIEITRANLDKYNFSTNPAEGLTTELLAASDIMIAVSFLEQDSETIKISFRSKGKYDVCAVAKEYSGGGHKNASGAIIKGKLENVKREVIEKLKNLYRVTNNAI